ncbi:zinc metalloproteinase-disintegrin-like NaMP isoform X2 [Microcaecilia unicolor]|uniref:Zinc metalloproteinase-disintegrin-like NaMP isoform X2 n=1 Tax=Microcaecilia unicolor TaxID=1415580 RepID=A0A6P7XYM8_9AMPH|nr:zinc metalloproteinase-disintegrin-like NaMP isoform X2 [Microcaecilia unicolor]
MHLHLLCLAAILLLVEQKASALDPLPGVTQYEVVYPQKLHSVHKRDTKGSYPDSVQYRLNVQGNPLVLHLEKTVDLISKTYTETYYLKNGERVTKAPSFSENCYYQGYLKNETGSSASISICNGIRGIFKTAAQRYLIEPLKLTDGEEHAVYEYETIDNAPKTCGVINTTWEEDPNAKTSRSRSGQESQEFLQAKKYVELYFVADNSMYRKYNQSIENIRKRCFETVNYVNLVYKGLNIFVALTGIEVWSNKDLIKVNSSANVNLDLFSSWRNNDLLKRKPNDNAQFITNIDFDGATVGLAYVGTMCSADHSAGVIQDHSRIAIAVGATVAHEMGHNLGMNHDTRDCRCPSGSCIMSPSLSYNTPREFSSCSHQNFNDYILNRMPECIRNKPLETDIIANPVCGNGFVERGEQCDCGNSGECVNPCCDANTCTLKGEAKCAHGECCENCQIVSAGKVCREVKNDCDIADMCNGDSPNCPTNSFRVNGYPCKNGEGYCYLGQCTYLDNQCNKLWGAGGVKAANSCYEVNKKGNYYGYCYKSEGSYVPCTPSDILCGVLYCTGGSDMPRVYASMVSFHDCKGVINGQPETVGMVENGTKCGSGKVCNSGRCVDIETAYRTANCAAKCKGHAVCDHELKCQCEEGWAPPNCDSASGASIAIIVVVVVMIIIVTGVIIGLLIRYKKFPQTMKQFHSTQPTSNVSGLSNPAFTVQEQSRKQNIPIVHTPELTARSLLFPPPPPGQATKPKPTFYNTSDGPRPPKIGYSSPQHVVTTPGVELNSTSAIYDNSAKPPKKPTTGPPPVPALKPEFQQPQANSVPKPSNPPPVPKGKPVLPAPPPQALKPTTNRPKK